MKYDIPECDILLHCGDCMNSGKSYELPGFLKWFSKLSQAKYKVFIAGNHDKVFQEWPSFVDSEMINYPNLTYLEDTSVVLEGLKIYGSPWQPEFCSWAFNLPKNGIELQHKWAKIPKDVDILMTHGPPLGILDKNKQGIYCGCEKLLERLKVVKPILHCFGHIHEDYGVLQDSITNITHANAASCTCCYTATNKPLLFSIDDGEIVQIE